MDAIIAKVRHCPVLGAEKIIKGRFHDLSLGPVSRQMRSDLLAQLLPFRHVLSTVILSSPSLRAQQTGRIIQKMLPRGKAQIRVLDELHEQAYARLEGKVKHLSLKYQGDHPTPDRKTSGVTVLITDKRGQITELNSSYSDYFRLVKISSANGSLRLPFVVRESCSGIFEAPPKEIFQVGFSTAKYHDERRRVRTLITDIVSGRAHPDIRGITFFRQDFVYKGESEVDVDQRMLKVLSEATSLTEKGFGVILVGHYGTNRALDRVMKVPVEHPKNGELCYYGLREGIWRKL